MPNFLSRRKNAWEGVFAGFRLCADLGCSVATPSCCGAASGRLPRKIEPSFEKLLGLHAESGVRFVVVGGVAMALRGYVRLTEDVVYWCRLKWIIWSVYLECLFAALKRFGEGYASELQPSDFDDSEGAIRIVEETESCHMDLFAWMSGRRYKDVVVDAGIFNLSALGVNQPRLTRTTADTTAPSQPPNASDSMSKQSLKKKASLKLPAEIWAQLYAAADTIFALKPWEIIPPDILLKVAHPVTNEPVFGSMLGSMGEVFGVSIQFGKWSEYSLMRAFAEDEQGSLVENVHRTSSYKIEFVRKSELSRADKERLKALAYKPKHGSKGACWPTIEVMKEGSVPSPPDAVDATVLLKILPCLTSMVQAMDQHANGDPDLLPEGIAVWPDGRAAESSVTWDEIGWKPFKPVPEPACEEFQLDESTAARLRQLPQLNEQLDLDAFAGFASVQEGPRPFFMKLGLAVNSRTQMVAGVELGTSGMDLLENIAGRLLVQVVSNLKARPKRIMLCQKSLLQALGAVAENLGIELRHQKRLPALEEARASMPEDFGV